MNKKIVSIIVFYGLFGCTLLVSAQVGGGSITNPLSYGSFGALITNIADQLGILIASLGGIMIIVSGILYLTSAGSPERVGVAKKALIYAIAGIAIGVAASILVTVIKNILGV